MASDTPAGPTIAEVRAAADRLAGHSVATPVLRSPVLDAQTGGTILLKAEVLQRTGSFKFRGAYNCMVQLDADARGRGVVAWSSGNHAQGVAAAAALLKMPAVIVMPSDAPAIKIANTRTYGAEVVLYDRETEDRERVGRALAAARGATIVPPFDDPDIIAGQGTVGFELMAQAEAMGLSIDDVIAPASGGGLVAGVGLAVHAARPAARIFAAEPEGYDDHRRSLEAGTRLANARTSVALCDALLASTPGALTWPINAKSLHAVYAVSDEAVRAAVACAFTQLKVVLEPSGAIALAAALSGTHDARGRVVGVILSGGNVDAATFTQIVHASARDS